MKTPLCQLVAPGRLGVKALLRSSAFAGVKLSVMGSFSMPPRTKRGEGANSDQTTSSHYTRDQPHPKRKPHCAAGENAEVSDEHRITLERHLSERAVREERTK